MLMVGTIQYMRDKKWESPIMNPALNAFFQCSLYKESIKGTMATHATHERLALGNEMVSRKPLTMAGAYSESVVRKRFIVVDIRSALLFMDG